MPSTDPTQDPSTVSRNYQLMAPVWDKIDTLLGGTSSMRRAGQTYLPMHENESDEAYAERLDRATLLNLTDLTLQSWVGRPFSDPVTRSDDMPEEVDRWMDDVDLQGNDVSSFGRAWFKEGLSMAFAHVLVDAPSLPDDAIRTAADDQRQEIRPFWNLIRPQNLIAMDETMVDGKTIVTHARILEEEMVRVGFSEAVETRIRVFDRILPGDTPLRLEGMNAEATARQLRELEEAGDLASVEAFNAPGVFVTVFRKEEDKTNSKVEWVVEQPPTRLDERMDEIPIVTFYADKEDTLLGKSPLEDLADLNVNWWQSKSDQNIVLTVARFPLLALSGGDEDESIVPIGPRKMLFTPIPEGRFYYVEHTGAAIEAGRQDLKDLEEQMAHYGAEFLRKRPGDQTATARALDSAEATSPLQDAAQRFGDRLNKALELTGKWVGQENVGSFEVTTEFGPEEFVSGDFDALDKARQRGELSKQDYFEELKRRGALRDEFDFDENERRVSEERTEEGFGGEQQDEDIDPFAEE